MKITEPWFLKSYFNRKLLNHPRYYHEEIKSHLNEGAVVLDAGCGSGEYGAMMELEAAKSASRIIGLDLSREALEKNEVINEGLVGNLENIPCADNYFDLVACETVCEHLKRPELVFNEFGRILKSGGYLVLRTYNVRHINNAISASLPVGLRELLKNKLIGVSSEGTFPTYYRCNSRKRLKKLSANAGMTEEKFIIYGDNPSYWKNRGIVTFFSLYERLTDPSWLNFLKMNIVGVYRKLD